MRHRAEKWHDGIEWSLVAAYAGVSLLGCLAGVLLYLLLTGQSAR